MCLPELFYLQLGYEWMLNLLQPLEIYGIVRLMVELTTHLLSVRLTTGFASPTVGVHKICINPTCWTYNLDRLYVNPTCWTYVSPTC